DSYTRNASIPGTYHLKLNFEDETGDTFDKDFEIVVVDRPADYFYSKIEAEEPENQLENEGNQYIIGGILAGFLIVSNVVWAVVFKKKH
ncbi:MAG: hypothetical protein PQJ44_00180, partial [Sphaerochaetaceae bacterium]|nr:hypothetical protein [Sphaerochaetaceae bacterium]